MAQWSNRFSSRFLSRPLETFTLLRRLHIGGFRLKIGQQRAQIVKLVTQVFTRHALADRQPQSGELARQVLGVGLGLRSPATILLECDPVPVLLTTGSAGSLTLTMVSST